MGPVWCVHTDHLAGHSFTLYRLFGSFSLGSGRFNGKPMNEQCPRDIYGIPQSTVLAIPFIIMCVPCENYFIDRNYSEIGGKLLSITMWIACILAYVCCTYFWFYSTSASPGPQSMWPTWWWDVWPKAYDGTQNTIETPAIFESYGIFFCFSFRRREPKTKSSERLQSELIEPYVQKCYNSRYFSSFDVVFFFLIVIFYQPFHEQFHGNLFHNDIHEMIRI